MNTKSRIIFLDYDGVVNSEATFRMEHRKGTVGNTILDIVCCSNVQYILEAVPEAKIVISSSWRKFYSIEQLQAFLSSNFIDSSRVIGVTGKVFSGHRGKEISMWLESHSEIDSYVVIDDSTDIAPHEHRWVKTDWKVGLTLPLADEAIKILAMNKALDADQTIL